MNKRTLGIVIVILAILAAIYPTNIANPQQEAPLTQPQTSGGLALLDQSATETPETQEQSIEATAQPEVSEATIDEAGSYTTKEDVSLYLYTYGHLPNNFITKDEARALGWNGGGLDGYDYGKCIGGDRFGNNEGLLPKASGRTYYECDIDTLHEDDRGPKRIVFSNDGLIYYTIDHYDSFELLYGNP